MAVTDYLRHAPPLTPAALSAIAVGMDDFLAATKKVQPSATREGFATTPDVTWDDVGALDEVRRELEACIVQPIRDPATCVRRSRMR